MSYVHNKNCVFRKFKTSYNLVIEEARYIVLYVKSQTYLFMECSLFIVVVWKKFNSHLQKENYIVKHYGTFNIYIYIYDIIACLV
jgi:hypothetical protein